jgi:hypothetical protein
MDIYIWDDNLFTNYWFFTCQLSGLDLHIFYYYNNNNNNNNKNNDDDDVDDESKMTESDYTCKQIVKL